jgi:hypothetical protein
MAEMKRNRPATLACRLWIARVRTEPLRELVQQTIEQATLEKLSLSLRLRGSVVTLNQIGGTYVRQRTPRRERADQCG